MGSSFGLHREAKRYTCGPIENFQDVIAPSTTVFACGARLIRQLQTAIAGVAFGTSDVGYLHLSLGSAARSRATNHQTEKSLFA